jgi:anaerobic selenocysteine-containing dehydrogenase
MISVDNWINETTRHAHVILPGLSPFEQPHHDDLLWNFAVGSALKWSEPIFAVTDRPHEWEILIRLAGLCLGQRAEDVDVKAIDDGFFDALCAAKGVDPAVAKQMGPAEGPERFLDLTIRTGPWGDRYGEVPDGYTLETVKQAPNGIDLGPMVPRAQEAVTTPDGRIRLAPPYITGDVARLADRLEREPEPLVLTSRRHLRSNNSWMHNVRTLVRGRDRCTLLVHPDDAARFGVVDGSLASVSSAAGSLEVAVEVSDEMKPGVVSLPHGWGHDRPGARLSIASEHAGVNSNVLAPGEFIDAISNNAAVNGIPVTIAPV